MTEFWDAATSPLGLVFGVPLVICLVLWAISIVGFLDLESDAGEGALDEAFESLGVAGVPPLVVVSIVTLIGWFLAIVGQLVVVDPLDGAAAIVVGLVVAAVALVGGVLLGARIARPLGDRLETARAPHGRELIGQPAVVRSGRVDGRFGYADADWEDGSQSRIEIRDEKSLGLAAGDRIRLVEFDPDASTYTVVRESDMFPETGD
ncbi:MAG: hypothetical protein AAGA99_05110 [Actinomycetota bacterium]